MKRLYRSTLTIFAVSIVLSGLVLALHLGTLPPQIPLFYSLPQGEEQITDFGYIFILPLLSLIVIMINTLLIRKLFKDNEFVAKIIYVTHVTIITLFMYVFIKIIFLIA